MTRILKERAFSGTTDPKVQPWETEQRKVARRAAAEGIVLLKNEDNLLPLKAGSNVALYGAGAGRTIKGGTGSGDVNERENVSVFQGIKNAGFQVTTEDWIASYDKIYENARQEWKRSILSKTGEGADTMDFFSVYSTTPFKMPAGDQVQKPAEDADTATAIYVLSRIAGEGSDRTADKGDYYLNDDEYQILADICAYYKNVIVLINAGAQVDLSFMDEFENIKALLVIVQPGMEGGNAVADILSGKVNPSGKLADTWAYEYEDYPNSEKFSHNNGNVQTELYEEGIYVGYRYFDTFGIKPAYEFGYGLSYTNFDINVKNVSVNEDKVTVKAEVTNTGKTYSGKEVVQVYFSAPDSKDAEKEYQQLAAYGKTDELAPGESQVLTLTYDTDEMAYYSEEKASYILDPGTYYVRVGDSSRNTKVAAAIKLNQSAVTEVLSNQMEVPESENLTEWSKAGKTPYTYATEQQEMAEAPVFTLDASKVKTENNVSEYKDEKVTTYTTDPDYKAVQDYEKVEVVTDKKGATLKDVVDNKVTMGEFVAQMSLEELAKLNCGSGWGVANENAPIVGSNSATVPGAAGETLTYDQYGIPSIVLADGPGGIRVKQKYEAKNVETGETATYYQYCTAWPVDFVLAQSWDTDLLKRIGEAFGKELEEMNITILLGPSLNIHRDPLCGRNFEYFSEDPVISGTMASAITLGVQEEPGVGACLKHFSANNQETDRSGTDSIVSERALREIYLKGFEIAVKESKPMSIMTSYNQINGVPAADSYDMNTNIARGEWGFEGLIMTDWNGGVSHPSTSMHAGNDLIMPGGASKANEIIIGAEDVKPTFEANGQIGLKDELMYMFSYKSAAWGDFEVSADGTQTAEAKLGDDYTASVGEDGKILVNGQEIYREYQANFWAGTGNYKTPVTTDVASVSEDGKTIVYKGTYKENNNICLGDVQKSAINNLKVIMQSRDMARIYGTTTRSYTALCGDLTNYQTVNKSEITTERTLKENLDQAKKDLEEAKKNLEELQKQNAAKDAEIAKAKAEVEAAKKDLQAAKMAAKKAAVKSVKSKKAGKAIVTVKKVAGAEGYQVQYSLKKSMKSAKNVKIKKNSITIKRLKKGKTYYVRVRAFSKDSNGKQICTAWSTAKKVTIKK